jgi:hypothetical protein
VSRNGERFRQSHAKQTVEDLNSFALLAGVLLVWGLLFYAGYTDLLSRIRGHRRGRRRRKSR